MNDKKMTRRAFLAATTTTAVIATTTAFGDKVNTAKVVPGKISPNEAIRIASIGAGGKGTQDSMSVRRDRVGKNRIVALCDVDWKTAEENFVKTNDDPDQKGFKKFKDYREMFDKMADEIDAVTISTPDHTHAPAAYHAMKLKKHVYVQKPLTHTIAEARLLQQTAKEMGVATQMGNQGHSEDGVREMCEIIWSGAIGDIKEAHIWTNRPIWPQGIAEALPKQDIPDTMDWDLWLGTAATPREYNRGYAPFKWRGWWDFGCGAIGDMACHIMDPTFWALKLMDAKTFSVEVLSQEGMSAQTAPTKSKIKFQFPARGEMPAVDVYWYDGGNLPERPADIPAGEKLGEGDNGSLFVGTKGYATTGTYGGGTRLLPEAKNKDFKAPDPSIPRIDGQNHYHNWLNAVRGGEAACSNFDYAVPLTIVANFGNVALFAGKKLEFDFEKFQITNDADANKFLTKEYRKGWELPC